MKKGLRHLMMSAVIALIVSGTAFANENDTTHEVPPMPVVKSSPELNRIKSLAGRWKTETNLFGKQETLYTEYEVTANGSAVLERIFPGTPNEMISVYYDDDNGKLAMTHYCIMGNRPTMTLSKSSAKKITMHVTSISGPKPADNPGMGDAEIAFKDKNHMSTTCGPKDDKSKRMTLNYTRVTE